MIKKLQLSILLFYTVLIFSPLSYSKSGNNCTRSLIDVLNQLNAQGHKIIYSGRIVRPWMAVLAGDVNSSFDIENMKHLLKIYGLNLTRGPQKSLLVTQDPDRHLVKSMVSGQLFTADHAKAITTGIITLEELNKVSKINSSGCFFFTDVPTGRYQFSIHYSSDTFSPVESNLDFSTAQSRHLMLFAKRYKAALVEELYIYGEIDEPLQIKKASKGFTETIDSKSLAQIPGSTPAELLKVLSGIGVSRQNGEARHISVRGLGGDYNMVTLNHRVMPSSSLLFNGGGDSSTRAFNFSNIASKSVSNIEVYKTAKAKIATGGVGGTVNIESAKPFDYSGLISSISLAGVHDTSNDFGENLTPEVFANLGFTSNDQSWGLYTSASYQHRNSTAKGAYVSFWSTQYYQGVLPQSPELEESGAAVKVLNEPTLGQLYSLPSDLRYFHADRERSRINAQASLQVKPIKNITGRLDYFYTNQEHFENRSELSIWMDSYKSQLGFDQKAVATPIYYWEDRREKAPRDLGLALQQYNVKNESQSLGVNLDWEVNKALSLQIDAHDSSAKSQPDNDFATWINIGMGANVVRGQGVDFSSDLPILRLDFDDHLLSGNGLLEKNEVGSAVKRIHIDKERTHISQFQLHGVYQPDGSARIDFGAEWRKMGNYFQSSTDTKPFLGGWGIDNPGDVLEDLIEPIDYSSLLSESPQGEGALFFDQASGGRAKTYTAGYTGNAAQVGRFLSQDAGLPWKVIPTNDIDRLVEESIVAAYVQLSMDAELAQRHVGMQLGLRYESTNLSAVSNNRVPTQVVWSGVDDLDVIRSDRNLTTRNSATYDHLLPNIDINIDLHASLTAKIAYSKSISRANYKHLKAAVDDVSITRELGTEEGELLAYATGGNTGLLPLESNNLDVVLEWHFDSRSYISLGYFEKRVSHFIGTETVKLSAYGLTDPTKGERAGRAISNLQDAQIELSDASLFTMMAANQLGMSYDDMSTEGFEEAADIVSDESDPLLTFYVNRPVNNIAAKIFGFESSAQFFFADSGFGVQANYTWVNSDTSYDVAADPDKSQFALQDLGDVASFVMIYEREKMHSQLIYSWRDEFLNNTTLYASEPSFTEAYYQLDIKLGYRISDRFDVVFEGLNLTGKNVRHHGRSHVQLNWYEVLEPRFKLETRYTY